MQYLVYPIFSLDAVLASFYMLLMNIFFSFVPILNISLNGVQFYIIYPPVLYVESVLFSLIWVYTIPAKKLQCEQMYIPLHKMIHWNFNFFSLFVQFEINRSVIFSKHLLLLLVTRNNRKNILEDFLKNLFLQ